MCISVVKILETWGLRMDYLLCRDKIFSLKEFSNIVRDSGYACVLKIYFNDITSHGALHRNLHRDLWLEKT